MIALCRQHHDKADGGSFTVEQLRALKRPTEHTVSGRFEWMRQQLLAVIGGNFYFETPNILVVQHTPVIWFTRDNEGHMLLNLRMLRLVGPRHIQVDDGAHLLRLDENDWTMTAKPMDFEAPPHGHRIFARYSTGDELLVEFHNLNSREDLIARYPRMAAARFEIKYPISAVEITGRIGGTPFGFRPSDTTLPGVFSEGGISAFCENGMVFD